MEWLQAVGESMGAGLLYGLLTLLCLAGFILSALSFSGPWFVVAASALAALFREDPFPGWWTLALFILIAAATEVFEFFASGWGVARRGGSRAASWAALIGGLIGMFAGAFLPVFLIGPLIGMALGSFALAWLAEYIRLKRGDHAAHIAWGAVTARIAVIVVKMSATFGMTAYLFIRMAL